MQAQYEEETLDSITIAVLQGLVMGLTFTEWMAKMREEQITYDLISLMSTDFFFAFDVIELLMIATTDVDVFTSDWLYVSFAFAFLAMFKYVPECPTTIDPKTNAPKGASILLIVSLFTNDIPFAVIRLTTMIQYESGGITRLLSLFVYPAKNIAFIIFNSLQLYIIYRNHQQHQQQGSVCYPEHRVSRCEKVKDGDGCECSPEGGPVSLSKFPENSNNCYDNTLVDETNQYV